MIIYKDEKGADLRQPNLATTMYKKKGNKTWHWSFNTRVKFPLCYMIMPKLPATKDLSHEFVEKIMERMRREEEEEKARLERRFGMYERKEAI